MLAIATATISAAEREPQLAAPDDIERAGAGVEPNEEAVPRRCGGRGFEIGRLDGGRLGHVG